MSLGISTDSTRSVPVPAIRQTLDIVVMYTSVKLAAAALERAEELAQGMELRVRLVCMLIVPYPLPVEQPQIDLEHLKANWRRFHSATVLRSKKRLCWRATCKRG